MKRVATHKKIGREERRTIYLCQRVSWVEEGELVPLEALHVLHHQREVSHSLEAQLRLQGVQHVLGRELFVRIIEFLKTFLGLIWFLVQSRVA